MAPKRKGITGIQSLNKKPRGAGPVRSIQNICAALSVSRRHVSDIEPLTGKSLPGQQQTAQWPELFAPSHRAQLAVNKKKVEELDMWIEEALTCQRGTSRCCCLSGPPGSGRATTVAILAKERRCSLENWAFPAPTMYADVKHVGALDYTSKLSEFESYVDRAKLRALDWTAVPGPTSSCPSQPAGATQCSTYTQVSKSQQNGHHWSTVKLVSDFPYLQNYEARQRFRDSVVTLASTAQEPTIILVTDAGRSSTGTNPSGESSGGMQNLEQTIIEAVKAGGGKHIAFNPLTERACVKEVKRVLRDAKKHLNDTHVLKIVQDVQCDLRNAIQTLQLYLCGGSSFNTAKQFSTAGRDQAKHSSDLGRDSGLNLFHGLGKILYNKRFSISGEKVIEVERSAETGGSLGLGACPLIPAEDIISRCGVGAQTITSFLFEHYSHFVDEDAIHDAAEIANNFSDAMYMLGRGSNDTGSFGKQWIDPEHFTQSPADAVAGMVSCRGYMWANQHPAPRKWHPLVGPKIGAVARAVVHNYSELVERCSMGRSELDPVSIVAAQVIPYARLMAAALPSHPGSLWLPVKWKRWWKDSALDVHGGGVESAHEAHLREEDPIED